MKSNSARCFVYLLLLCTFLSGQVFSQELKIERKERLVSYLQDGDEILKRWIKVGDDLYQARFIIPLPLLRIALGGEAIDDPFANPPAGSSTNSKTFKEFLKNIGINFGKGAKASYNHKNSILTVVQTRDQLEMIEAYFSMGCRRKASQIPIRAEIYELPSALALELIESCADQIDHSPERNAARQLVKEGDAKLISLPSTISRSGQRSKIVDAYEVPFLENIPNKAAEADEKSSHKFIVTNRPVGTIFEVDTIVGANKWTLDISLILEHHTGPPEFIPVSKEIKAPIFHSKKITTQITLLKGNYLLIGSWKPTGKPEYEKKNLMHVVFLTANIQYAKDYGVLQPVEDKN